MTTLPEEPKPNFRLNYVFLYSLQHPLNILDLHRSSNILGYFWQYQHIRYFLPVHQEIILEIFQNCKAF